MHNSIEAVNEWRSQTLSVEFVKYINLGTCSFGTNYSQQNSAVVTESIKRGTHIFWHNPCWTGQSRLILLRLPAGPDQRRFN